jgi:plasmid stabilization system protein ParE
MRVIIDEQAQEEARQQVEWYRQRNPAAARRLEELVISTVERIARNPLEFSLMEVRDNPGDIRRVRLRNFPLLIIYQVLADEVLIVAFAHTSREPEYWRARLRQA